MAEKLPIRTVFDGDGNATGLAEFQSGEFIGVTYGGIGTNTLTTNSILLGNGTSAVQNSVIQISGSTISSSDSTLITIDDGLSVTGNLSVTGTITGSGLLTSSSIDTLTNKTLTTPIIAEIDNTTSITLDAGTDINLDADGGNVYLKDGGTQYGNLKNNSGELQITSGSSDTTAITMSGADVTIAGNLTVSGTTTTVNSTTIDIQNSLRFEGSTDNEFETNLTVTDPTADRTITFPDATGNVALFATAPTSAITDGSNGQVLKTDGSGNLTFGSVATNLNESTLSSAPGSEGDFDLSFDPQQSSQESPFESSSQDAFGIALSANTFSYNDPVGLTNTIDLGAFS
jgi:hypothetical protein